MCSTQMFSIVVFEVPLKSNTLPGPSMRDV